MINRCYDVDHCQRARLLLAPNWTGRCDAGNARCTCCHAFRHDKRTTRLYAKRFDRQMGAWMLDDPGAPVLAARKAACVSLALGQKEGH